MNLMRAVLGSAVLLLSQYAAAAGNLVDGKWLAANLQSPDVLVLDAQPRPMHAKAHVPGAVPVDVFAIATFGVRDTPLAESERFYQKLGIDSRRKVVIYDQGGTWFAPRIFFQLAYHGFPTDKLAILDGGMAKWQADGLPVTADATPAPQPGTFRVTKVNEQERARVNELVAAAGDRSGSVLVDALGPEYHYGATQFFNKAGHIPNAISLPSEDFFNADKTFKSPEEIRRMMAHMSIRPEQEVQTHCGGGGAAAVPYFAMKYLGGHQKTRLSVESQMGWLQDERDLPFWTYATPGMMRDVDWLKSWGGRMMRMYGVSRVSFVDVRSPEAYSQGHVPFAVNVPGEAFRGNGNDSRKLAEILGASGVDPSHEAIIISGAGLTKDAALAYVALEKAGQKKVSVLMDSLESPETLDRLARGGLALTKEAKVVPVAYVPAAETKAAGGVYPKVYVASGAAVPARAVDGKVVHVPYTELLKPDGTPKAAKDIWAVLAKAGVPRYAELVAISDDPGEAAVNYYILKLMGYADVKIA